MKTCTPEFNSYNIHVMLTRMNHSKVYFFNVEISQSSFDVNSVVFHFDDFNYGRWTTPILMILIMEDGLHPSLFDDCNFNSAVRRRKWNIIIAGLFSPPMIN